MEAARPKPLGKGARWDVKRTSTLLCDSKTPEVIHGEITLSLNGAPPTLFILACFLGSCIRKTLMQTSPVPSFPVQISANLPVFHLSPFTTSGTVCDLGRTTFVRQTSDKIRRQHSRTALSWISRTSWKMETSEHAEGFSGVNCTLSSVSTRVSTSSVSSSIPYVLSPDCAIIVSREESRVSPSAAILVRVLETTWEKPDTATVSHGHPRRSFDIRSSPGTCLTSWIPDMTTEPMVGMLLRRGVDCTFSELSNCGYISPTAWKARYKLRVARTATSAAVCEHIGVVLQTVCLMTAI